MTYSFSRGLKGAEQASVLYGAEPTRELSAPQGGKDVPCCINSLPKQSEAKPLKV